MVQAQVCTLPDTLVLKHSNISTPEEITVRGNKGVFEVQTDLHVHKVVAEYCIEYGLNNPYLIFYTSIDSIKLTGTGFTAWVTYHSDKEPARQFYPAWATFKIYGK